MVVVRVFEHEPNENEARLSRFDEEGALLGLVVQPAGGRGGEEGTSRAHTLEVASRRVCSANQNKNKTEGSLGVSDLGDLGDLGKNQTKPKPKQTQDSRQQHSPTHEKTNKQKRIHKGPVLEMLPGLPGCGKYRGGRGGSSQLNCHSHSRVAQGYHAANSH